MKELPVMCSTLRMSVPYNRHPPEWSEGTSGYVLYTATTVDTGSTIDICVELSDVQLWRRTILDSGIFDVLRTMYNVVVV